MYATTTPFPAPEPGEYLNFREAEAITGLSEYTLRGEWEQRGIPFELICGRRLVKRDALLAWVAERTRQEAAKLNNYQAEAMWLAMQERRAAR